MGFGERPVIGFLSDFGLDSAAATCRGVILGICRDAQVVDICHTVRKYAVRDGAYLLRASLPYLPIGAHLAVIDPGVGTARRPIAVRTGRGDVLVGPDNGLLLPATDALGGAVAARALDNPGLWLSPTASSTFHGRDIFAPVVARLAAGAAELEEVGPSVSVDELTRLPDPAVRVIEGQIETEAVYVDSFGNVRLAGTGAELSAAFGDLQVGDPLSLTFEADDGRFVHDATRYAPTFDGAPAGAALLYLDSSGNLALADNRGNAARRLGLTAGMRVTIRDQSDGRPP